MPYKDPKSDAAQRSKQRCQQRFKERHPGRALEYTKAWRAKNSEHIKRVEREYKRRMAVERPDDLKDARLRSTYGVGLAWLRATSEAQGGRCAICRLVPVGKGCAGTLHIDHDHATGAVRELLCNRCNQAIARLREDPAICRAAALYLERHNGARHVREA